MMGALPHEPEEGEHAGPGGEARREGAAARGLALEPFEEAVQPVARIVEGVVAGKQLARLREEDHDEPHRDPAGGAVDVLRGRGGGRVFITRRDFIQRHPRDIRQVLVVLGEAHARFLDQRGEGLAVSADEDLDRLAHPLAEHLGELRLPLAGVADRLEEGRRGVLGRGRPEPGGKQRAKRAHLWRELAFLEPEVDIPLAPRFVVEPGEHEPPLPAVRHQGEVVAAGAKPAEHPAHHPAAPADPEPPPLVQEHREAPAALARPEMAGLHGLAGDRPPSPRGRDPVAARPRPGRGVEAADFLQHEGDEGRRGPTVLGPRPHPESLPPAGGAAVRRTRRGERGPRAPERQASCRPAAARHGGAAPSPAHQGSRAIRTLQQGAEAGLLEVDIPGQCIPQLMGLHDHEAHAVGERPCLVGMAKAEGPRFPKAFGRGPLDAERPGRIDRLEENRDEPPASPRLEQGDRFIEHVVRRDESIAVASGTRHEPHRSLMHAVRSDEQ